LCDWQSDGPKGLHGVQTRQGYRLPIGMGRFESELDPTLVEMRFWRIVNANEVHIGGPGPINPLYFISF
jgi:hypothetical protein